MPLPTYTQILRGKFLPGFRIASGIPCGHDIITANDLLTDELYEIHDELAGPFYDSSNPLIPEIYPQGEISLLELKALIARRLMSNCSICENLCRADRTSGKRGKCRVGKKSFYASEFLHIGEEAELVPSHTIFFTGCTIECIYCQNWDIAHGPAATNDAGNEVDDRLIDIIMMRSKSARNLNLVGGNPDQHLATIMSLLVKLAERAYPRPIVWNSNMYMTSHALSLLTGVVDVHLADFKYGTNECGEGLSRVKNYFDVVTRNLLAVKPVSDILIRHLVLPGHVECCTARVVEWVRDNLPDAQFNLMFQYHPDYMAAEHSALKRYLTAEERAKAMEMAIKAGVV